MDHVNFSSLPPDQEATFVVYERRTAESLHKAMVIALVSSILFGLVAIGIYFGVSPEEDKIAKDMDLNHLKKKSKTEAAPTPEAPEAR
jgi:hypothetical protein